MARQRSIRIDDELDRFIEERVGNHDYRNADDVVEAGLRLLKRNMMEGEEAEAWFAHSDGRPMTMEELREAIREGEESGLAEEVDFKKIFDEVQEELENERAVRR